MKRAIIYMNRFDSDKSNFSTSGTKYEIVPGLYQDDAGEAELRAIATNRGMTLEFDSQVESKGYSKIKLTHVSRITNDSEFKFMAFVSLPDVEELPARKSLQCKTNKRALYNLINNNSYQVGIVGMGESIENETWLIIGNHSFYHILPLLGYSIDSLIETNGIDGIYFDDEVSQCSMCGMWARNDDGYRANFHVSNCELIGVECGCWHDHCTNDISEFVDDAEKCIELSTAEELENSNKIEHLERFIGGMVDGRGGYWAGGAVREGNPKGVLKEYANKFPDDKFVFSHDESGQFQAYFSIWRVI